MLVPTYFDAMWFFHAFDMSLIEPTKAQLNLCFGCLNKRPMSKACKNHIEVPLAMYVKIFKVFCVQLAVELFAAAPRSGRLLSPRRLSFSADFLSVKKRFHNFS